MSSKRTKLINKDFFMQTNDGYVVVGSKCKSCGKVYFPKKKLCTNCLLLDQMEIVPLSKKGKLVSYSVAYDSMLGIKTPYAFGYIDLPEGIRIYSLLTDCEPFDEKLKIGMDVEMVIEKMMTDEYNMDIICYKFRPIG
jgi:benzoylsuccinyl-CoA thiolase BbsA subunit